jgi:hypothetical protein
MSSGQHHISTPQFCNLLEIGLPLIILAAFTTAFGTTVPTDLQVRDATQQSELVERVGEKFEGGTDRIVNVCLGFSSFVADHSRGL